MVNPRDLAGEYRRRRIKMITTELDDVMWLSTDNTSKNITYSSLLSAQDCIVIQKKSQGALDPVFLI